MTLIFSGHTFKYEIEAIAKLFFPAQNFNIVYDLIQTQGDFCFVRRKKCRTYTLIYVIVFYGQKSIKLAQKVENNITNYENSCEQGLSRLLFKALSKLTGKYPSWGTLTGIRPVKRINSLIDKGIYKSEIFAYMKNKFFVTDDKLQLAYNTAVIQKPFLDNLKDNSFSLYVSIPFCPSRCNYCSFVSHSIESTKKLVPQYVEKLCMEIEYTSNLAKHLGLELDTIYIGGGTPTSLNADQLSLIMRTINECFDISNIREYTVEAGRADTITYDKLLVIKNNGATRISINPQTLNDSVLREIGRNHTAQQTVDAFKLARSLGFDNINVDLIAGLSSDSVESFIDTINKIVDLNPENITVHTLSLKRSAEIFQNSDGFVKNPVKDMVEYACSYLQGRGYNPYYLYRQKNTLDNLENVGYSRKSFESIYNINIMEEIQTILAVGAGGSTKPVHPITKKIERVYNYKFPYEYIDGFNNLLLRKDQIKLFYEN